MGSTRRKVTLKTGLLSPRTATKQILRVPAEEVNTTAVIIPSTSSSLAAGSVEFPLMFPERVSRIATGRHAGGKGVNGRSLPGFTAGTRGC